MLYGRISGKLVVACGLIAATISGCSSKTSDKPLPPAKKATIRILVVDDEPLATAIKEEWEGVSDAPIELTHASVDEVLNAKRLGADLVFYPSWMLGHLAESKLVRPLDVEDLDAKEAPQDDLLRSLRMRELVWDGQLFAQTLGSPTLVLMYRADIFAELEIGPPATWTEYIEVQKRLRQYLDSQVMTGVSVAAEPQTGSDGALMLLARAAAYCRRSGSLSGVFNFRSGVPLIDSPPFVRALREMRGSGTDSLRDCRTFSDAREAFESGKALMAFGWPTRMGSTATSPEVMKRGFAELPGSMSKFNSETNQWMQLNDKAESVPLLAVSGRLGSLTSEARRLREATQTLAWLTGQQIGNAIGSRSQHTTLFRRSQLGQGKLWTSPNSSSADAAQYANLISGISQQNTVMFALRIPHRSDYLQALQKAIDAVLVKKVPAQAALNEAAKRWGELNDKHGATAIHQAYQRSYSN